MQNFLMLCLSSGYPQVSVSFLVSVPLLDWNALFWDLRALLVMGLSIKEHFLLWV
jgi:hypothetical protein